MPISTNQLRVQVDTPVWDWCRLAPAVSSALSSSCNADNTHAHVQHGRYIYYLISATGFWRYDTWTDTYLQLSSPAIAPVTWTSMKFSGAQGFEGQVLSATNNTFTAPAYYGQVLKDFDVRIDSGTGMGQRRTITSVADAVVADTGVPTAVTALTITDTLKAWTINQWAGYQVRITFGTGVSLVRRILYNTATVLTFVDTGMSEYEQNCNPIAPSPALSVTAGAQSIYSIESSVYTVNSDWDTNPDTTSSFLVESGIIYLFSSAAATPFYTVQKYDIASDTWYILSATTLLASAAGTDGTIERTTKNSCLWESGTATGGTTTTLTDTTQNWTTNSLVGKWIRFVSGTKPASSTNQMRQITANTATEITWSGSVVTAPDSTTKYRIAGFDAGYATGGTTSTTLEDTNASATNWTTNRWANYMVEIVAGTGAGQTRRIASNTATTITLLPGRPWTVTPDTTSAYVIIPDFQRIYFMLGGQCNLFSYDIQQDMACHGRLFDYGAAAQGTVTYAGRRPMGISTITRSGTTATCTTVNAHTLKVGDAITIAGATGADAALYNISTTVVSVTSTTAFTYTMAGTPTGSATFTGHSTTTLTDASKAWTVNQWANYVCYFATASPVAATGLQAMVAMEISSNTATTLTFKTATTAPTNGISRYIIAERPAFGSIDSGIANGTHSTTTLQDTTKTWVVNIHAGRRMKTISGAGQAEERIITSNTANTLTLSAVGTLPISTSTTYAILEVPVRGAGISLIWASNPSIAARKGVYMYIARGGAVLGIDRFNINTGRWDVMSITPQIETLTTGSQYAYDGVDRLYFTKDATMRMYYLDLTTNWLNGAGMYPYVAGTAVIGNRMEIYETADGLKFLWINRPSFQECYKQLLFY